MKIRSFLRKIFSAKKNEYTKIAVTFTASKGQALRVFATIIVQVSAGQTCLTLPSAADNLFAESPHLVALRVVFCQKTLTAATSLAV